MKIVFLTSTSLRHKYIAARLSEHLELELVIAESKSEKIEDTSNYSEEDAAFLEEHFRKRLASEEALFGGYQNFPEEVPLLELPHGEINSSEVTELVENIAPDYVILFGTSILNSSLLESFRSRIINLHLGLSPYYKGSATNLFPYYYNEPECIGATLHLVTVEVDGGEILHQLRSEIEPGDDLHQIGNKVVLKAGKQLPGVLKGLAEQKITPQPQLPAGRICWNKDFTPQLLREIYEKFEKGLIEKYLEDKERRDAAQPIVDADLQLE